MAFSLLSLSNTFFEWLIRVNDALTRLNQIESGGSGGVANTAIQGILIGVTSNNNNIIVTGGNPQSGNTVTIDMGSFSTSLTDTSTANIASANVVNTVYQVVRSVYTQANTAYGQANTAMNAANTAYAHADDVGTVANSQISLLAPKASPGFTGNPTAPTAANTTSNTQIATTAFVRSIGPDIADIKVNAGANAPLGWLLCYGQAISRSTYASLFGVVGTTFGAGNGSTTFNVPDLRGRTIAGLDNMGGSSAARLSSVMTSTTRGAVGGVQTITLSLTQIPSHTHKVNPPSTSTSSAGSHSHTINEHTHSFSASFSGQTGVSNTVTVRNIGTRNEYGNGGSNAAYNPTIDNQHSHSFSGSVSGTTGGASDRGTSTASNHTHTVDIAEFDSGSAGSSGSHDNVQPTMVLNYLIYTGVYV